ncbi:tetratricopeptide repeat protein [Planctomycetota bacterium]
MIRATALSVVMLALLVSSGCRSSLSIYLEGVKYLEDRQFAEAVGSFSSVIQRDAGSDLAYLNRGDAYRELGEKKKALEDYNNAIQLLDKAPNPWFYNRRGLVHYELENYEEALTDWRTAKDLEDRRRARGYKVRKSKLYVDMLALREELLVDAERQAETMPSAEYATASPGGSGQPKIGQPDDGQPDDGQPGATPPEVTSGVDAADWDAALQAAQMEHDVARLEYEEERAKEGVQDPDARGADPEAQPGEQPAEPTEVAVDEASSAGPSPDDMLQAFEAARAVHDTKTADPDQAEPDEETSPGPEDESVTPEGEGTSEPTEEVTTGAEVAEPPSATSSDDMLSAFDAARMEHDLARLKQEEDESQPAAPEEEGGGTPAPEEQPTTPEDEVTTDPPAAPADADAAEEPAEEPAPPSGEDMFAAFEAARMDHDIRTLEADEEKARVAAAAEAAAAEPAQPDEAVAGTEPAAQETPADETAQGSDTVAGAGDTTEPAPLSADTESATPTDTPPAAATETDAAPPKRVASLSGRWEREDLYVFTLLDDGYRVVGEIENPEDFSFYEVVLEWKGESTLEGHGMFKEQFTDCKFETSVVWKMKVVDGSNLQGEVEEPVWDESCKETGREWVEFTFTKQEN